MKTRRICLIPEAKVRSEGGEAEGLWDLWAAGAQSKLSGSPP